MLVCGLVVVAIVGEKWQSSTVDIQGLAPEASRNVPPAQSEVARTLPL